MADRLKTEVNQARPKTPELPVVPPDAAAHAGFDPTTIPGFSDEPSSPAERYKRERQGSSFADGMPDLNDFTKSSFEDDNDNYEMGSLTHLPPLSSSPMLQAADAIAPMKSKAGVGRGSVYHIEKRQPVRRAGKPIPGKGHTSKPLDADKMQLQASQLDKFRREIKSRGVGTGRVRHSGVQLSEAQKLGRRHSLEMKIRGLDQEIAIQKRRSSLGARPVSRARQYVPGATEIHIESKANVELFLSGIDANKAMRGGV